MNYLLAFLFAGLVCGAGQIIMDNTKLTAGHITSIFAVTGAFLSFLGIYDKLIKIFGAGASVLISNFGHMLYQSSLNGYYEKGFLGIFSGMLEKSSLALTSVIIFSFILTIFFNPKD